MRRRHIFLTAQRTHHPVVVVVVVLSTHATASSENTVNNKAHQLVHSVRVSSINFYSRFQQSALMFMLLLLLRCPRECLWLCTQHTM